MSFSSWDSNYFIEITINYKSIYPRCKVNKIENLSKDMIK